MDKIIFKWNEKGYSRTIRVTNAFNKCSLFEDYNIKDF